MHALRCFGRKKRMMDKSTSLYFQDNDKQDITSKIIILSKLIIKTFLKKMVSEK